MVLSEAIGHGLGRYLLRCRECSASWVGFPDETCGWCIDRKQAMEDDERKRLLFPPWAINGGKGVQYDSLDLESQQVWRESRGQRDDTDSYIKWLGALRKAVDEGSVTESDAIASMERIAKWLH